VAGHFADRQLAVEAGRKGDRARAAKLQAAVRGTILDAMDAVEGPCPRYASLSTSRRASFPMKIQPRLLPQTHAPGPVEPIEGRDFTQGDAMASQPVVLVNQSFARRLFPGAAALGRQIRVGTSESEEPWRTIVGVVPDLYMQGLTGRVRYPADGIYVPVAQADLRFMSLAVRGQGGRCPCADCCVGGSRLLQARLFLDKLQYEGQRHPLVYILAERLECPSGA